MLAIGRIPLRDGFPVTIIDSVVEERPMQLVRDHLDDALCVGITAQTGYQIHEGLEVSRVVKQARPRIPVIWGGWHPSALPDQTAMDANVDVVVRGQGELTFGELARKLAASESIEDIAGITFRRDGRIVRTADRPFEDVNNFPPLPFDLIDVEKHIFTQEFSDRCLNYVTSQGCPWRCGFCADPRTYRRRWSALKAERVVNEVERLSRRYDVDGFTFDDDNFFVNETRVRQICQGFLDRGLDIKWGCAPGRVDELLRYKDEAWELMRKSGLKIIFTGAESGSNEALELMTKDFTVDETLRYQRKCKVHGIKVCFSFMMGMPHDPQDATARNRMIAEEFHKTLTLIGELVRAGPHNILFYFYTPYPGTPLYDLSLKAGLKEPATLEEWARWDLESINAPWISKKYLKILEQLNHYILPYLSNQVGRTGSTLPSFRWPRRLLYELAAFRWRTRFFELPIEHRLIKFYEKQFFYPREKKLTTSRVTKTLRQEEPREQFSQPFTVEAIAS